MREKFEIIRIKAAMTIFITICVILVHGQGYFNKWYFGNHAGLDFNTIPPTPITGMTAPGSNPNGPEGQSSISDASGNLLFYTDGMTVWNRNHAIMTNGSGLFGHNSCTQSATIVPDPGNTNQYYIFTLEAQETSLGPNPQRFSYSVVDMTQSGGLGAVTTKNVLIRNKVSEKIVITPINDGTGYWIVVHDAPVHNVTSTDLFLAYQLTASGLNPTPVTTNIGYVYTYDSHTQGQMKVSGDGSKIAASVHVTATQVFDFNNATGVLSNCITLNTGSWIHDYAVEFSPNSKVVYSTGYNNGMKRIFQYDLTQGTEALINASRKGTADDGAWQFQLGPDCKIYVAHLGSTYLGVINNPDAWGGLGPLYANYVNNQVTLLAGTNSQLGLPNFYKFGPIPCTPVPVEMLGFYATCQNGVGLLEWATASETNNYYFVVMKSTDGTNFNSIGWVMGQGNSNQIHHYTFIDEEGNGGLVYYQLNQVDFDGASTLSPSVYLNCTNDFETKPFSVINQPGIGEIQIIFTEAKETNYHIFLMDYLGNYLLEESIHTGYNNSIIISTNNLNTGVYFLYFISDQDVYKESVAIIH